MMHINPASGKKRNIKETPVKEIPSIIEKAREAQKKWALSSLEQRRKTVGKLILELAKNQKRLAMAITHDMGKPLKQSAAEVHSAVKIVEFYYKNAHEFLKPEKYGKNEVSYEPVGVVAVISPWNYPLSTPLSSVVPALIAGNAVVLKQSGYSPSTGIEIEKMLNKILPKNIFNIIIGGRNSGKSLVAQDVDMVSFTGSSSTGKHIMKTSSAKLHKLLLELGGLDAAIVLDDADVKEAAKQIVHSNVRNSGQVCCAVKRVYVEKDIYDDFVKHAVEISKKIKVGDPMKNPDMGPLAAKFQLDKIKAVLKDAVKKGAKILTGGKQLKKPGYFFPSTVVIDVNHNMQLMKEEPFGPILPIYPVNNWQEAVKLANNTKYGLTGSVWTKDRKLGRKIAEMLEVGVSGINAHGGGPLGTPWGGVKHSGIGRLGCKEGIRAFTNAKVIKIH
jgi:succinate-semialdehyde dehydrogenase/glutarate-semialdehyde dehydrogenase/succinyl-CoA reductase